MIDQKQLELKFDPVDINVIIESVVRELRFFFALRKLEISTHLDQSLPMIRGDKTRLMQLLSNILGNAIKFTPDEGVVSVTTKVHHFDKSRALPGQDTVQAVNAKHSKLQFIEIIITDSGIGINEEDQHRIFDKFYEAGNIKEHSSGKIAFKSRGAGLGLSIARGIVEMHGGQLWVESSGYDPVICQGSSFFIILPLDPLIVDDILNIT